MFNSYELNDFSFHNMTVLYRLNFSYKRINAIKDEASFKAFLNAESKFNYNRFHEFSYQQFSYLTQCSHKIISDPDIHFMVIFFKEVNVFTSFDCIRYCSELSRPIFVSTKKYRLLTNLSLFYIIYFTILFFFLYAMGSQKQWPLIQMILYRQGA